MRDRPSFHFLVVALLPLAAVTMPAEPLSTLPCVPDCRGVQLASEVLTDMNLNGVDMTGADLSNANLNGADLRGADLMRTSAARCLTGATMIDVQGCDDSKRLPGCYVNSGGRSD